MHEHEPELFKFKADNGSESCATPMSACIQLPNLPAHCTLESAPESTALAWHNIASAKSAASRGHFPKSDALDLNAKDKRDGERGKNKESVNNHASRRS